MPPTRSLPTTAISIISMPMPSANRKISIENKIQTHNRFHCQFMLCCWFSRLSSICRDRFYGLALSIYTPSHDYLFSLFVESQSTYPAVPTMCYYCFNWNVGLALAQGSGINHICIYTFNIPTYVYGYVYCIFRKEQKNNVKQPIHAPVYVKIMHTEPMYNHHNNNNCCLKHVRSCQARLAKASTRQQDNIYYLQFQMSYPWIAFWPRSKATTMYASV